MNTKKNENVKENKLKKIGDVIIEECDLGKNITVREYMIELLSVLWEEEEGFSGKRPFGNSGWQAEVYIALIQAGVIEGNVDIYDGYVEDYTVKNIKKTDKLIIEYIKSLK